MNGPTLFLSGRGGRRLFSFQPFNTRDFERPGRLRLEETSRGRLLGRKLPDRQKNRRQIRSACEGIPFFVTSRKVIYLIIYFHCRIRASGIARLPPQDVLLAAGL